MADMDEDDSPYAEVRASVSNMDDPDLPGMSARSSSHLKTYDC
jgi:hypothetical protein